MNDSPNPSRAGWVLAAILCVGAFLRFYQIASTSMWMDEIWSIEMSLGRGSVHDHLPTGVIQTSQVELTSLSDAQPWWHIWNSLTGVTTAPLYIIFLRWWMDIFGNFPAAARSLSALFSVVTILIFFDVCRLLHNRRIGLLAAAIMAIAPAQIEFGQETRSYSLLILICLCAADALIRQEKLGFSRRRSWCLAGSLLAAALTHYFAAGAIAALALYAATKKISSAWKPFLIAAAVGGLLWGFQFWQQIHSLPPGRPAFLNSSEPDHATAAALQTIGLPAQWLVAQTFARLLPAAAFVLLAAATILLPLIRFPWRRDTLLWLIWIAATALPLALSDIFRQTTFLDYLRYTILASPAAYALLASIDFPLRPIIRDTIGYCALALCAFFTLQRCHQAPTSKEDWRELATRLDREAQSDDLLVFTGNDPWASPGTWYMGFKYYAPQSDRPWLILQAPADPDLLKQLAERRSIWVIGRYPTIDGPADLPGWHTVDGWATTAGAAAHLTHP
jgi:hypothetical protein